MRTTLVLLVCVALVGGCSRAIGGSPTTPAQSATEVAGLPVTNGDSGLNDGMPDASLPVAGTDNGKMDNLARNAVADIDAYWRATFPKTFPGREFSPVPRLTSYDSTAPGGQVCGQSTAGNANAFYCPPEDSVAWDRADMLPKLNRTFGPMAVVTVLAHEMGHAVQHRAGTATDDTPVIVLEQQADCFTGAFFRHVAEGSAEHFHISTGTGLNTVLGTLSYIRDTPGENNFTSDDAHGSAFDRVSAFQQGFTAGPARCARMNTADVQRRTTQFRFWKQAQETDLPVSPESLHEVESSLREVFANTGAPPPSITTRPPACPGRPSTPPASYCPQTNTISLDLRGLQTAAQPPRADGADSGYGDFAAYAQVASRYALSVQQAAGMPVDDQRAGLRTACLVGAWSGLLVEDPIGQRNPVGRLRLAPGDVDEGIAGMLGERNLIAANARGQQVPAGFARTDAFRTGFQQGTSECGTKYD